MPKNVIGTTKSTTFQGSTDHKVFNQKGQLFQGGKPMFSTDGLFLQGTTVESTNMVQPVSYSTAGVPSSSTLNAFGVSYIYPSTAASTSPVNVALSAPIPGVDKTIIYGSTAGQMCNINLGSVGLLGTSDWDAPGPRWIFFSTLGTQSQAVNLIGLSTALWGLKSIDSTVGVFGVATGIRTSTATRTS